MGEPTHDRHRLLGGLSAGAGTLASIFLGHLLGIDGIRGVSDLLVWMLLSGACGLLAWFLITGALRLLRGRPVTSR